MFANAKGGVGKTTVTALSALGFAAAGYQVGLRDTDVDTYSLTRYLKNPAFKNTPAIIPAPPGTNGVGVILIDSPPRLRDRAFLAGVSDANVICLVTQTSLNELEPTADTLRAFQKDLPEKCVRVLINCVDTNRKLTRDLEDNLRQVGLRREHLLKNRLERREQYRHALVNGWDQLEEKARNPVLMIGAELFLLATQSK
jgi:cellulose biosynthesis protein BcsQ